MSTLASGMSKLRRRIWGEVCCKGIDFCWWRMNRPHGNIELWWPIYQYCCNHDYGCLGEL